jgi:hypothetical protein
MMNCKVFGRKQLWSNFKVLSWHSPGGTEENHENPQISIAGRWGRDLNLGPPKYKAGVLTTRPQRSVRWLTIARRCHWKERPMITLNE